MADPPAEVTPCAISGNRTLSQEAKAFTYTLARILAKVRHAGNTIDRKMNLNGDCAPRNTNSAAPVKP